MNAYNALERRPSMTWTIKPQRQNTPIPTLYRSPHRLEKMDIMNVDYVEIGGLETESQPTTRTPVRRDQHEKEKSS